MKLHIKSTFALIGSLVLNSAFAGHAVSPAPLATVTPGKIYLGIFGGGGSSNSFNTDQYGTAFFTEAEGGPLAVNAFGHVNSESSSFIGLQLGYQAQDILLNLTSQWSLVPAIELEGYYLNQTSFDGTLYNNTTRLPQHDFDVTYPMKRNVFLTNIVLSLNQPCLLLHPYIGFGVGAAIARISGADSLQVAPPEAGVNHYNANTSDTDTSFAGQFKIGLSYDLTDMINIFAEYRWLYISNTHFTFGSTVYPGHAATSSWEVNLDPQRYNLGSVGIRVNL